MLDVRRDLIGQKKLNNRSKIPKYSAGRCRIGSGSRSGVLFVGGKSVSDTSNIGRVKYLLVWCCLLVAVMLFKIYDRKG